MTSWCERFQRTGIRAVYKQTLAMVFMVALTAVAASDVLAVFPCCKKNCTTCQQHSHAAAAGIPQQPMRISPLAQQLRPDRVLIVTPLDRQDRLKEQVALMRRLATKLRAKSGFDVIEASERVCEETFPIRTGQFDERKLVQLGRKYLVDTVMYCNIESIDAYCPMRLEIQFLLVNVNQSVSIVSGSQRFDLSDKTTESFFYQSIGTDRVIDTTLKNSPSRLIDFGASRVAGDLSRIWN